MLHAGEADEIIAHAFEFRAFAVILEGLFRRAVEAEGDVVERAIEQPRGSSSSSSVPLVESSVEMLWRWQNSMRSKILGSISGSPRPISIMCSAVLPDSRTGGSKTSSGHVFLGLLVGFSRAHGAIQIAFGGGFDDVFDRQRR